MKIQSIIVDDESDARQSLQLMVEQFYKEDIEILAAVSNVKEAVKAINSIKPELIFLDVEMPRENGFQLFDYFGNDCNFEVIFTTAYQQYAIQAFRCAALDYLIKPIDYRQLGEAIQRYKKISRGSSKLKIQTFVNNLTNELEINKKILLPSKNGYDVIPLNNILYCEADINYTIVHSLEGKSYTIASTLKSLEETLPDTMFFRTHKTYLVNLNYVKALDKSKGKAILESNHELDIASRRMDSFVKALTIR